MSRRDLAFFCRILIVVGLLANAGPALPQQSPEVERKHGLYSRAIASEGHLKMAIDQRDTTRAALVNQWLRDFTEANAAGISSDRRMLAVFYLRLVAGGVAEDIEANAYNAADMPVWLMDAKGRHELIDKHFGLYRVALTDCERELGLDGTGRVLPLHLSEAL